MATVPTPYDATAAHKLTAVELDSGIRDPLNWLLTDYPRVHAHDASGVSCVDTVGTLITFDSEVYDNDSMHSTSSNTGRIVFTTAGLYNINTRISLPSATYTVLQLRVALNSGGAFGGGTALWTQSFVFGAAGAGVLWANFDRFFTAADYIEVFVQQTSGANRTTAFANGALANRVQARWLATA